MKQIDGIMARRLSKVAALIILGLFDFQPFSLSVQAEQIDGSMLFERYQAALSHLPALPNLTYRQQVDVTGRQTYRATLDGLLRQDGSWQVWVADGETMRQIDSGSLDFVIDPRILGRNDLTNASSINSVERQSTEQIEIGLDSEDETYRVQSAALVSLNDQPAYHLVLGGTGQLQELWLDPSSLLPYRAQLMVSDVWGEAQVQIDFQIVEENLLPSQVIVDAIYDFRVLWVNYHGHFRIQHQFQNYQFISTSDLPTLSLDRPPIDGFPEIVGLPEASPDLDDGGTARFDLTLQQSDRESHFSEQIAEFNMNRPQLRDPVEYLLVLIDLRLAQQSLPLYLIEVNTDKL